MVWLRYCFSGFAGTIALFSLSLGAFAHGGINEEASTLRDLTNRSALIVRGEVTLIRYSNSQPSEAEPKGVPHTFVTYQVSEVIKGTLPNDKLTLRFVGGAGEDGSVHLRTTVPTFNKGHSDILFVDGGPPDACPLVDCADGRFRISNGSIYNAWGVPVIDVVPEIVIGGKPEFDLLTIELPSPKFDDIIAVPEIARLIQEKFPELSTEQMRRRYNEETPATYSLSYAVSPAVTVPAETEGVVANAEAPAPISARDFLAIVKSIAADSPPPRGRVIQPDANAPFTVRPPQPQRIRSQAGEVQISDEELREQQSLWEGEDLQGQRRMPDTQINPQPQRQRIPAPRDRTRENRGPDRRTDARGDRQ